MRKLVRYILVVAATLVILILLWQFRVAIVLFALSLALAAALRPSINNLAGRRISRKLALGIVYFLLTGSILSFLFLIGQPLAQDLQNATDDFVTSYEEAKNDWPQEGTPFQQVLAEQLPPSDDLYKALTSDEGVPVLEGIFGAAQNFLSVLGNIAIIIILSLYWSADQLRFERLGLSLLPRGFHPKALRVWRSVEAGVGSYLRSELIQSILAGLLLGVGYWFMGIRYPVIFTLWAAVARLIPWFGVLIAALPLTLIELGTSPVLGLLATMYTVGILLLLKTVIEPRFFHRQRYNSLLIVLFVIILAESLGVIGVMLAPLLAVTIQTLLEQFYPPPQRRFARELRESAIGLRKRLRQVRHHMPSPLPGQTATVLNRLQRLTKQVINYSEEY